VKAKSFDPLSIYIAEDSSGSSATEYNHISYAVNPAIYKGCKAGEYGRLYLEAPGATATEISPANENWPGQMTCYGINCEFFKVCEDGYFR